MTVIDLAIFTEEFLRSHHPEWFDHQQTFEAHFGDGRCRSSVFIWNVDPSLFAGALPHLLKSMEQREEVRMRYIRWQNGDLNIVFSADYTNEQ